MNEERFEELQDKALEALADIFGSELGYVLVLDGLNRETKQAFRGTGGNMTREDSMASLQSAIDLDMKAEGKPAIKRILATADNGLEFDSDEAMRYLLTTYPGFKLSLTVIDNKSDKAGNFSNMQPEENLHYMRENVLAIETYLATGVPN